MNFITGWLRFMSQPVILCRPDRRLLASTEIKDAFFHGTSGGYWRGHALLA